MFSSATPKQIGPWGVKLAAMLEADGWKVWWDTNGDDFRKVND